MSRCHDVSLFVGPPPPSLCCPIDGGAMRDAIKSTTCGHVFGMRCALDFLIDNESCPVCGITLDCSCLAPVQHVRDAVHSLIVRCPEERCDWTGPLSHMPTHVGSADCAVKRVACPFCHGVFEDGEPYDDHKPVCPEFIAICPKCEADMPRRLYPAHEATCKAVPRKIPRLSQLRDDTSPPSEKCANKNATAASPSPKGTADANASPSAAAQGDTHNKAPSPAPAAAAAADTSPAPTTAEAEPSSDAKRPVSPQTEAANTLGIGVAKTNTATTAGDEDDALLRSLGSAASPTPSEHQARPGTAPQQADDKSGSPTGAAAERSPPATTGGRPPRVPTPPTSMRSPSPNSAQAAEQRNMTTVPCPFVHLGCDPTHTGNASNGDPCQAPAVLSRHLALMCTTLTSLQARHDKLELQVEALKTQELRRTRGGMNSTVFSNANGSRLNTSTSSLAGGGAQRTSGSARSPRDARTPNDKPLPAKPTRHIPPVAPLNLGAVQSAPSTDQAPKSATASPSRLQSQQQFAARPSGSAQPLTRSTTALAPVVPAGGGGQGARHVGGASNSLTRSASNPASARSVAVVAPITAWKAPPPDAHPDGGANDAGVSSTSAQLKKTSAAARSAAKELLELRTGAGGIAYKDLVSVLPARSPAKAASPTKGHHGHEEQRKPPRVIPPVLP